MLRGVINSLFRPEVEFRRTFARESHALVTRYPVPLDPHVFRTRKPFLTKWATIHLFFRLAGVQGGRLFFLGGRCLTVLAPLGQSLLNLPASLAEVLKLFLGKALYLEAPISVCALDFIPQRRQLPRQLGAVVGACILDVAKQLLIGKRAPLTIRTFGEVENNRMGMGLRVKFPAGIVAELGNNQVAGIFAGRNPINSSPRLSGHTFEVCNRPLDRDIMGFAHFLVAGDFGQQGNTFRGRKGEVYSWAVFALLLASLFVPDPLAQLLAIDLSL